MTRDLLPEPTPVSEPYWDAIEEGRFVIQQCQTCDEYIFYPRDLCPHCFGELEWAEASGHGRVHTYTTVYQTPVAPYSNRVPYVLAIIELDEGPHLMANVINCHPESINIGTEVTAAYEKRNERTILQFEPTE